MGEVTSPELPWVEMKSIPKSYTNHKTVTVLVNQLMWSPQPKDYFVSLFYSHVKEDQLQRITIDLQASLSHFYDIYGVRGVYYYPNPQRIPCHISLHPKTGILLPLRKQQVFRECLISQSHRQYGHIHKYVTNYEKYVKTSKRMS